MQVEQNVIPTMVEIQLLTAQMLELEARLDALSKQVEGLEATTGSLSIRLGQLEKAHNRLAHFCGQATESTTVGQDNWAEAGEETT